MTKRPPFQVIQDQRRDLPAGGHAVCPVSGFVAKCRRSAPRTRHRIQPRSRAVWWHGLGPMFADGIRKRRIAGMRSNRLFVKTNGQRHYLWRSVDHEGEVLESLVTKTCDKKAALKIPKNTTRKHSRPEVIATGRHRSYGAALKEFGAGHRQEAGRWLNNRAENSHPAFRRRERDMLRFRQNRSS